MRQLAMIVIMAQMGIVQMEQKQPVPDFRCYLYTTGAADDLVFKQPTLYGETMRLVGPFDKQVNALDPF